jgi:hypothetical protein
MVTLQILPNQIYNTKHFKLFFSVGIVLLLLSFIFSIVFFIQLEKSNQGQYLTNPKTKSFLYSAIPISFLSFISFFVCFWKYYKIFGIEKSFSLTSIVLFSILSLIIFIVDILFSIQSQYCPDNMEFSKDLNMCIDICPHGYYQNTNGGCTQGCQVDKDCGSGNVSCLDGICCNLDKNKILGNECCPNDYAQDDKYCCASPICTSNGKSICCDETLDLKCVAKEGEDPYCTVQCGGQTCKKDEYCISYPKTLKDGSGGDDIEYVCSSKQTCTTNQLPQFNPASVGDSQQFYPAFDSNVTITDSNEDDFLNNKPDNSDYTNYIDQFRNEENSGYICGLDNAIQFETTNYQQCDSIEPCLSDVQYPFTQKLNVISDDKGGIFCNQIKNFTNKQNKLTEDDTNSYYTISSIDQTQDNVYKIKNKQNNFATEIPATKLNDKENTSCSDYNYYRDSCDDFNDCSGDCPFDKNQNIECKYEGQKGYIVDKTVGTPKCIITLEGEYTCQNVSATDPHYSQFPDCKNGDDCTKILEEAQKNAASGDEQWFYNNLTDNEKEQMQYCGVLGCWEPGYCPPLSQGEFTDCQFNNVLFNNVSQGKFSACPKGSKPVFWVEKVDDDTSKIHYNCCNPSSFKTSQIQSYEMEPDKKYCLDEKNTFKWIDWGDPSKGSTEEDIYFIGYDDGCCKSITPQLEYLANNFFEK